MPGLTLDLVLSDEDVDGIYHGQVDADYLDQSDLDFSQLFYLCGPPAMQEDVSTLLKARGVADDRLVHEDW